MASFGKFFILHINETRATTGLIGLHVRAGIQTWLSCGMSPSTAIKELAAYTEFRTVCIVGHEPDLSSLVAWLTGSTASTIQMKTGSIAVLEVDPPSRHATLEMLLPAKESL